MKKATITLLCLFLSISCYAHTITVNAGDSGDYPTIQAAIDAAQNGDLISVYPGTYYENIRMKDGVDVIGSGADVTTIDGGGNGHVVVFNLASGAVSGFTITNGGYSPLYTAGVFTSQCSAVITDNIVTYNANGIFVSSNSNAIIMNNQIMHNNAPLGCGIEVSSSDATIINNVIARNGSRAGIYSKRSSTSIINNTIVDNGYCGINFLSPSTKQNVINNIITSNEYGLMAHGDGSSPVHLLNISYNNNWNNSEAKYWYEWGIICPLGIPNCQPTGESKPFMPLPGTGELCKDPLFKATENHDYHLMPISPCINAGDPCHPYDPNETDLDGKPRIIDGRIDMGAYEFNLNTAPVAVAGPNQTAYAWLDGIAEVTLDGSASYDDDGDPLTYLWGWTIGLLQVVYEANGMSPTIELPVGQHTIYLIVNDGIEDSEPNHTTVTVIEPLQCFLRILPRTINHKNRQRHIMAWLSLPEGITKDDIDKDVPLTLYPGRIEASRQFIFENKRRDRTNTSILAFFNKRDLMNAVGENGPVQLDVVGRLNTGRYFFGQRTVRIINPPHHRGRSPKTLRPGPAQNVQR